MFDEAERKLEKVLACYHRGIYSHSDVANEIVSIYFEAASGLKKELREKQISEAEYLDKNDKLQNMFGINRNYFRPAPDDIARPLSGSLYVLENKWPDDFGEPQNCLNQKLILTFHGIHAKELSEPFSFQIDRQLGNTEYNSTMYASCFDGHGCFEGYHDSELSLCFEKGGNSIQMIWKCYPICEHERWKPYGKWIASGGPIIREEWLDEKGIK